MKRILTDAVASVFKNLPQISKEVKLDVEEKEQETSQEEKKGQRR